MNHDSTPINDHEDPRDAELESLLAENAELFAGEPDAGFEDRVFSAVSHAEETGPIASIDHEGATLTSGSSRWRLPAVIGTGAAGLIAAALVLMASLPQSGSTHTDGAAVVQADTSMNTSIADVTDAVIEAELTLLEVDLFLAGDSEFDAGAGLSIFNDEWSL